MTISAWLANPRRQAANLTICLLTAACLQVPGVGELLPTTSSAPDVPVSLDRQEAVVHRNLGIGLASAGDIAGAVDELKTALSLGPWPLEASTGGVDESPYGDLARICDLHSPEAQVIRACTIAVGSSRFERGRLAELMANRGDAYQRLGEYDRALADYENVLKVETNDPRGLFGRGRMRARTDEHTAAISDFDRSISAAPELFEARLARARSFIELGAFDDAIADYDYILSDPASLAAYPDTYRDRAWLHCLMGEADAAAIGWQVWLADTPGGASYVQDMLWARGYLRGSVSAEFDSRTLAALRAWTTAGCPGE